MLAILEYLMENLQQLQQMEIKVKSKVYKNTMLIRW